MSVQAMSYVIDHSGQKGSALLMLLMIANHARSDGTGAWPAVQTLAQECRMSKRQSVRLISQLEESGELLIDRNEGPFGTHRYTIAGMQKGDDILAPPETEGGVTPRVEGGDKSARGVTPRASLGDTHVTQTIKNRPLEPSRTVPFDDFWKHYPPRNGTKGSRKNALAAWKKLDASQQEKALSSLAAYAKAANGYPKDAERYLRGELWDGLDVTAIGGNGLYRNEDEWTPAERGIA